MEIPLKRKKEIVNDWKNKFPQLSVYSSTKLYGVIDIAIIGIELVRVIRSDDYRPHIVCYPLWYKTNKDNLSASIILQEVSNLKGLQCDIPYSKHDTYLEEAVLCTRKRAHKCLDEPIYVESILRLIDVQMSELLVRCSPFSQSRLYQLKLFVALYMNDNALVDKVMDEIKKASAFWEARYFNSRYGDLDAWFSYLKKTLDNRDEFLDQIKQNRNEKEISKLNSIRVIY